LPAFFWFVQKFLEAEGLLLFIAALVLVFLPVDESEKLTLRGVQRNKQKVEKLVEIKIDPWEKLN